MKKRILIITAIVLLLATGAGFALLKNSPLPEGAELNTALVEKILIDETIEVSGNIQPVRTDTLRFNEQGKILRIHVTEGQDVTKGQLISELSIDEITLQIEQKKYSLEQEKRAGSVRSAQLMQMELDQLIKKLDERKMFAPYSGIIGKITYKEGDFYNSEKALLTIFNTDSFTSYVNIDELDIPIAKVGQRVLFDFSALPGKQYKGYLSKLAPVGKLTEYGLAVREAELRIDNPARELFSPYSFRAQIMIREPVDTLVLDEKTLIRENDRIYVTTSDSFEKKEIEIKPYKTGKVIVLSGLEEGDEVLIPQQTAVKGSSLFGDENEY